MDATEGLGVGLVGGSGAAVALAAAWDSLPPYPGPSVVPPVTIPDPPTLPADAGDRECAQLLVRAWVGASFARYGKRIWTGGDVTARRDYSTLVKAADLMRKEQMPPAAWVAFSIDYWRKYTPKGCDRNEPPAARWVFAGKRLAEQAGWFRSEWCQYRGGRIQLEGAHAEILRRYARLLVLVRRGVVPADAVAETFPPPGDDYETLAAQAAYENKRKQSALREAAARGEWLW